MDFELNPKMYDDFLEQIETKNADLTTIQLPSHSEIDNFLLILIDAKNISLATWITIVKCFYLQHKNTEFEMVMQRGVIEKVFPKNQKNDKSNIANKVYLFNLFAAYHLEQACKEKTTTKRDESFGRCRMYVNKSDLIEQDISLNFALKAYQFLFDKCQIKQTDNYFDQSLSLNPNCVAAFIGKANACFETRKYEESLEYFKKALKINPKLPANVRLGMAYNFFYLEKFDLAQAAFQRVLQLEHDNVDAMIGLAVLESRKNNQPKYFEYIENAFQYGQKHPILLLHICEIYLNQNKFDKARVVALKGIDYLEQYPRIQLVASNQQDTRNDFFICKSRFLFVLGYISQKQEDFPSAIKYFELSVQADQNNLSAQYSTGQMKFFQNKDYMGALKCFETIVNKSQNEKYEECYRILGYLYNKQGNRAKAIEFNTKAMKFNHNDFDLFIEQAQMQEQTDQQDSLDSYLRALTILETRLHTTTANHQNLNNSTAATQHQQNNNLNEEINSQKQQYSRVEPELYNNIGVLLCKLKRHEEAHDMLKKAQETCMLYAEDVKNNSKTAQLRYSAIINTINFNFANYFEEIYNFGKATVIYKQIIKDNQYYIDAQLRLAYNYFKRGSDVKALDQCEAALKKIEKLKTTPRVDSIYCLKAFILSETGDIPASQQCIEQLRKKYKFEDSFTRLFLAKLEYDLSTNQRDKLQEQKSALKSVLENSRFVIEKIEENNIQAAMSIAVVLAELGFFREAKEILNQLIEFQQQNTIILLNQAHLYFLQKNYDQAIQLYCKYLASIDNPDDQVELQIVICNWNLKNHKDAIRKMKRLLLRNPQNLQFRFNYNVLIHEYSHNIIDQKFRQQESTHRAISYLKAINPIYEALYKNNQIRQSRVNLEPKQEMKNARHRLNERIKDMSENKFNYIKMNEAKYDKYIREDEERLQKKQENEQRRKLFYEEVKQKKMEEEIMERQKKLEEIAHHDQVFMQTQVQAEALKEQARLEREEKENRKLRAQQAKANKGKSQHAKHKGRTSSGEISADYYSGDDDNHNNNYNVNDTLDQMSDDQYDLDDDGMAIKKLVVEPVVKIKEEPVQNQNYDDTNTNANTIKGKSGTKNKRLKKRAITSQQKEDVQDGDYANMDFDDQIKNEVNDDGAKDDIYRDDDDAMVDELEQNQINIKDFNNNEQGGDKDDFRDQNQVENDQMLPKEEPKDIQDIDIDYDPLDA